MKRIVKHAVPVFAFLFAQLCVLTSQSSAQITGPRILSSGEQRTANLEEYLINRLKATGEDQQNYVRTIVGLINAGRLDAKLVLAIERLSQRRSFFYPLPYFERALKVQAAKRGVIVPMIREVVATRSPLGQRPLPRGDTRLFD